MSRSAERLARRRGTRVLRRERASFSPTLSASVQLTVSTGVARRDPDRARMVSCRTVGTACLLGRLSCCDLSRVHMGVQLKTPGRCMRFNAQAAPETHRDDRMSRKHLTLPLLRLFLAQLTVQAPAIPQEKRTLSVPEIGNRGAAALSSLCLVGV